MPSISFYLQAGPFSSRFKLGLKNHDELFWTTCYSVERFVFLRYYYGLLGQCHTIQLGNGWRIVHGTLYHFVCLFRSLKGFKLAMFLTSLLNVGADLLRSRNFLVFPDLLAGGRVSWCHATVRDYAKSLDSRRSTEPNWKAVGSLFSGIFRGWIRGLR